MGLKKKVIVPPAPAPRNPTLEALILHREWIERLAQNLVLDSNRADDLMQQVWMAALKYKPNLDRDLRPWLFTVAKEVARKIARSEARFSKREREGAKREALQAETALLEREETRKILIQFVHELEEPYRSTLLMHFFQEIGLEDIASRLRIPSATVRTRLRRGLERLRTRLKERFGDQSNWGILLLPIAQSTGAAGPASLALAPKSKPSFLSPMKLAKLGGLAAALILPGFLVLGGSASSDGSDYSASRSRHEGIAERSRSAHSGSDHAAENESSSRQEIDPNLSEPALPIGESRVVGEEVIWAPSEPPKAGSRLQQADNPGQGHRPLGNALPPKHVYKNFSKQ